MRETPKQKKQAENEMVFRQANEKVTKDLIAVEEAVEREGDFDLKHDAKIALHFYCECSNEDCIERIKLTAADYKSLHKNGSQFIVLPGHNTPDIERIVEKRANYYVVEKYMTPPTGKMKLKKTK